MTSGFQVCEGFLILDNDIAKDASMELTALDMILDWCDEILRHRSVPMPEHLVIEAWRSQVFLSH